MGWRWGTSDLSISKTHAYGTDFCILHYWIIHDDDDDALMVR